jgi:hypothetical protein
MLTNLASCTCRQDERAAALLKALWAEGYRIAPAGNASTESEHRATR